MGQAKARGTFEERKAQAIERRRKGLDALNARRAEEGRPPLTEQQYLNRPSLSMMGLLAAALGVTGRRR